MPVVVECLWFHLWKTTTITPSNLILKNSFSHKFSPLCWCWLVLGCGIISRCFLLQNFNWLKWRFVTLVFNFLRTWLFLFWVLAIIILHCQYEFGLNYAKILKYAKCWMEIWKRSTVYRKKWSWAQLRDIGNGNISDKPLVHSENTLIIMGSNSIDHQENPTKCGAMTSLSTKFAHFFVVCTYWSTASGTYPIFIILTI